MLINSDHKIKPLNYNKSAFHKNEAKDGRMGIYR